MCAVHAYVYNNRIENVRIITRVSTHIKINKGTICFSLIAKLDEDNCATDVLDDGVCSDDDDENDGIGHASDGCLLACL